MKDYKLVWKALANAKQNTAFYTAQYYLIKATKAKSNQKVEIAEALLRRAFTPVTNKNELANGRRPWDTLNDIVWRCQWFRSNLDTLLGVPALDVLTEEEYAQYKELARRLGSNPNFSATEQEWVYIFVRQDISPEYQAVQACHASHKSGRMFNCDPDNTWFCLIGVKDEAELYEAINLLENNQTEFAKFIEPDIGDQLTAVATRPIKAHKRRFLCHYERLRFGELNEQVN